MQSLCCAKILVYCARLEVPIYEPPAELQYNAVLLVSPTKTKVVYVNSMLSDIQFIFLKGGCTKLL